LRRYSEGSYSMDGMTVDGAFNGTFGEALQLSGDVSFALPSVPGKPMVSGAVAFGFKGALGVAVAVVDGTASLEYICHEGTLTMSGSAASVSFGPVVLTGVAVDFAFYGAGMKSFDAKISGVVDVKMLPTGALPDGGSLPTSSTPLSSVSLRVTETDGFVLDKLIVAIGLDLCFTSESSGMVFGVTGELSFVYPCGDKEQAYGVAKLSAFVPGALAVTDFDLAVGAAQYVHLDPTKFQFHSSAAKPHATKPASSTNYINPITAEMPKIPNEIPKIFARPYLAVTYNCGNNLTEGTPRFSVAGQATGEGIEVAGVTLSPFSFAGSVYSGGGLSGFVSGSAAGDDGGGGELGAVAAFAFDTRHGSWSGGAG